MNTIKLITLTYLACYCFTASAVKPEVVMAKCYIEFSSGEQTIHLREVDKKSLKYLSKELTNKTIPTGIHDKSIIAQVFECAPATDRFKSKKARLLEEKLPR